MTMIDGKAVGDCFAFVARCGLELNALRDALENLLTEQLTADKSTLPCVLVGGAKRDERRDDGEWVCTDFACSFPLKSQGKGRKSVELYLGFQVSMSGDGIEVSGNNEPLIHVFCWEVPVDFQDYYMGFPLDFEDPHKVVDERLLLWGDQNASWNERQWTYSLRLMSINSIDDLNKYVVVPALELLKGKGICDVLPDEWLGKVLVRYPEIL